MNPIDSQTLDELDKYITGKLTDLEKNTFESRLSNEPELKLWFDWLKETTSGMESVVINDNKSLVKEWLADDKKTAKSNRNRIKIILLFVLLLSLAGLAAYFIFQKTEIVERTTIQIVNAHIDNPYKSPTVLRNGASDNWQNSIEYYSSGDYTAFLEANEDLIIEGQANNEQKLYIALGNIYKNQPNHEVAIQYLTELLVNNSGYEDLALWYRSLSYLKLNDHSKAKIDLELLISRSNYKVKEAQALLDSF